ncbi:MAG: cohesin domain-containing protein [Candidatus Methylumidiphilus sp.]
MYSKIPGILTLALTTAFANASPFSVPPESSTRGSLVEVSLIDQGITGLEGASIRVHFDPTVLNFDFNNLDAVQPGAAIESSFRSEFNMALGTVDNILVSLSTSLLDPFNGSGEILRVLFQVASNTLATSTQVSFESFINPDYDIHDPNGNPVAGTVNISLGGQPNQSVPHGFLIKIPMETVV